jgi:hypothetical protein
LTTDRRGAPMMVPDLLPGAQVVLVEVDNPYGLTKGDKSPAFRSLRDDPIERLFARRQIDEAQRNAGAAYRRDLELAEFGGARAIDPTKEAVDGGAMVVDLLTDSQKRATARLIEAGRAMGLLQESIVRAVISGNLFPGQVAVARGFTARRVQENYAWLFRQALDALAVFYRLASKGSKHDPERLDVATKTVA